MAGVLFVGLPLTIVIALVGPLMKGPNFLPVLLAFVVPTLAGLLALGIHHQKGEWAAGSLFGFVGLLFVVGLSFTAVYHDECRSDTLFLKSVRARIDSDDLPTVVNADLGSMDIFRILFYLGEDVQSVHNLTFLRDTKFQSTPIYVVTRSKDFDRLKELGQVQVVESRERNEA